MKTEAMHLKESRKVVFWEGVERGKGQGEIEINGNLKTKQRKQVNV